MVRVKSGFMVALDMDLLIYNNGYNSIALGIKKNHKALVE
jgi:hypothetical protein